ncbi:MAG TPA: hypothetical protein ENO21_01350, partial [Firmicutes bacterium]|nr:hypothetical protein [Bacillota bacterium]
MIKFDRFTQKARESLEKAQAAMTQLKQTQLDTEHLLYGITFVEGSLVDGVLEHAGLDVQDGRGQIRKLVERGQVLDDSAGGGGTGQIYLTPDAHATLEQAEDEMEQMGDKFVGTEHILLALISIRRGRASALLAKIGLSRDAVYAALKELRGTRSLDSESGEEQYQALERFT